MPVEALRCPNCGAPLDEINDITRCSYCNNVIHIQLGGSGLSARLVSTHELPQGGTAESPDLDELALPADEALTAPVSAAEAQRMAAEILALLHDGSRIPAIRLYKNRTGLGLRQSKEDVELLEQDPANAGVLEKLRKGAPARSFGAAQYQVLLKQVEELLRAGNKPGAIRLYLEKTGCSLKEANDSVEAVEARVVGGEAFTAETPVRFNPPEDRLSGDTSTSQPTRSPLLIIAVSVTLLLAGLVAMLLLYLK
jgi:ribosomal protein L7/L12